ncbi:GvpL/GvpF family gas vesicle protein [Streptomyces cocklensis]|jgi:hypothetical protein|uniref:Gas vesicle synthesis protein GvpL/GvpF n=1 Tax=Actinacidiphila cocklensis TaxID=887465 RepID=A0A9W4DRI4_9ACTN|nr:GvpL/GvpF family gas vesicle protein [Actinacidiphila cocklensis]MDD1062110.1 GvpL/GvpF family gas vesicle protein [Actinacidiphila cocklensis]WSX74517.1 GvpL/GvpF family gas vesicle protein [Streptomyces sp. NBC_00899]CAG6396357.1 Gas vesicle synthesis protein GvpL/GvpF [Actinacidiphila cocklensis]
MTATDLSLPHAGTAGGDATATCVFAVRRDDAPEWLPESPGHAGGGPVGLLALPGGGLQAVVQPVAAADFTEEALRRRLSDPVELERCARTHHAVITAAAADGPVVPLPLATLFTGVDRAVAALADQRAHFLAALDRVTGRAEWAVKVHVEPSEPARAAPDEGTDPATVGTGAGAAYLARVRGRERDRRARQEAVLRVAGHVHEVAAAFAVAAVRRTPHSTEITGKDRPQVLNAAYLVDDARAAELVAAVRALDGTHTGLDVHIEVSGPWVPYSFTRSGEGTGL